MTTKRQNSNTHYTNNEQPASPNTTYFNYESSKFFNNHHLSSKSSDDNNQAPNNSCNDVIDFLNIKHKSLYKRLTNIHFSKRKSFDFSYNQNELLHFNKLPILTQNTNSNNDFYNKYHSNSAIVSGKNYTNYILKSDIEKNTLKINRHNVNNVNDNLILKYYTGSTMFSKKENNIKGEDDDKGFVLNDNDGSIESNSDECRNELIENDGDDSDEGGFVIMKGNGGFNLNYIKLGKSCNGENADKDNDNMKKKECRGIMKEDNNIEKGGEFILTNKGKKGGSNKSNFMLNFIRSENCDNTYNMNNTNNILIYQQSSSSPSNYTNHYNNNLILTNNHNTSSLNTTSTTFPNNSSPKHSPHPPTNNPPISSILPPSETQDLLSKSLTLIQDQQGCRYLQKKITEDPRISDSLFINLYPNLLSMCTDSFGNYLIQKMLDFLSTENISLFTSLLNTSQFIHIATSTYGTRVIQKLLEIFSLNPTHIPSFHTLNSLLINNILSLSCNSNSSHIIIKYVHLVKHPDNISLYECIINNFIVLCKDKHGCCVIQKAIESANQHQKETFYILCNRYCKDLINDQFGNYVIQYVVGLNTEMVNKYVNGIIMENVIELCKEKYASNVIERFICNKNAYSKSLIEYIIRNEIFIHELLVDCYGNYIIQRILMIVEGEDRMKVVKVVVEWFEEVRMLSFGERLIAKLSERYHEFNMLVKQVYGIVFGNNGGNTSLFYQQKMMMEQYRMKMNGNGSNYYGGVNGRECNAKGNNRRSKQMNMNVYNRKEIYNSDSNMSNLCNNMQQQQFQCGLYLSNNNMY